MHADSGKRLGEAHPHQEGPVDLRLVPPALAAWATAALTLDAEPGLVGGLVIICLATSAILLAVRRGRARNSPRTPGPRSTGPRVIPEAAVVTGTAVRRRVWPRVTVAASLLCAAAAAASAGLHGADLRRGPVPALAGRYASVTAEVELTSDPRLTRPRVRGDHAMPDSVMIEAEVRRVETTDRTVVATRTPVLLIVDAGSRSGGDGRREGPDGREESGGAKGPGGSGEPGGSGRAGRGGEPGGAKGPEGRPEASWLALLPSTRLRVAGRLAPALARADRFAAVLRVRDGTAPSVVGRPSATQRAAGRLRAGLRVATDGLPADARALLPGLVVGDTSRITPELDEAFKETDLAHTLAVSGSNLTIILALLLGPPGLAQQVERRGLAPRLGVPLRATAVLGAALTLGFVVVCRPDPSVLRAAACGAIVLLALATGRRRSLVPALATAVLLLVLYDPWLARSYGFLLSVLATGALLTLAPRWSAALRGRRVPPRLAEALAAAGAAQALCAPVVAVLSARVSLVAVPCNLLVEFAVAPATVLGFAVLATAPVTMPVAEALAWCAGWPAGWIAGVARTGAALPGAAIDWPGSWAGALSLAVVTLVVVLFARRLSGHPWLCVVCGVLLLLVVVRPPPLTRVLTGWPPPGWRLAMCDVGQGDASVLAAGDGVGVVVDAGPDPALVDQCLRTLGITRVPLVVLTHFHADHVAGLPGVLRGREVGAVETTGFEEPVEQVKFVRQEARARNVPVVRAVAGERRRVGALEWEVLWPPPLPAPGPEGPNDASVTMLVRSAGLRMLLLGDLEPPAQRALSRSPAAALVRGVDVLKVAHHGSAYQDPDLIRAVAPRLALISCGADNPYGHPAPSTVAALRAGGAMVLRTDRDGALAVVGGAGGELGVARD
ncbi:ComEC/Rec2 family competence protein [Streptomyces sp. ID05-04B]|uniref:ComEC/Rec2 family competence protein n=1 Tax=Streptomyces sp. ID05-04B TaxID=3028661 RepID=UPI0029C1A719|nr:ComEC/Rec2 family competence protein [Streptomyces sp. ID05-04B]MDX5562969.1 ComEC/Rec2 family competence protein [Streptomyces sp. ID05-04B]